MLIWLNEIVHVMQVDMEQQLVKLVQHVPDFVPQGTTVLLVHQMRQQWRVQQVPIQPVQVLHQQHVADFVKLDFIVQQVLHHQLQLHVRIILYQLQGRVMYQHVAV